MIKTDLLYKSFLELKDASEVEAYLSDLLTKKEINDIADRLWIAAALYEGKKYTQIAAQTKASSRTIARVAKWLNKGVGYKTILRRLHHHQLKPHLGEA